MPRPNSQAIRDLRRRKALTISQLARRTGIGERTIRRLESGRTADPHPETMAAIARALGVLPEELFEPNRRVPANGKAHAAWPAEDKPSLVVLPFENLSAEPDQDFFALGLTEDLTARLSSIANLFVISRNSAQTAKERLGTIEEIGRGLSVRYVLEGSVQKAGERARITAELIEAASTHQVWTRRYDREVADIFALQAEIAEGILSQLSVQIRDAELQRIRKTPTRDLSAYEAYVKGYSFILKETRDDNNAARALFERAIELDPSFADPYAGLSLTFAAPWRSGGNRKTLDHAETLARRAVSLDPQSGMGHSTLGIVLLFMGRFREARVSAEVGAELAPGDAASQIIVAHARLRDGEIQEGLRGLANAIRHEPNPTATMLNHFGVLHHRAGRASEAILWLERARAASPIATPARLLLIYYYETGGEHDRAQEVVSEVLREYPRFTVSNARSLAPELLPNNPSAFTKALLTAGLPGTAAHSESAR